MDTNNQTSNININPGQLVPVEELNSTSQAIKNGIDNNGKQSPSLSIDPETDKMSVVGDPNDTKPTSGNYKLSFLYPSNMVTPEDKTRMQYEKDTDEYRATVTYENCRVKPLYRTKITLLVSRILSDMGVIDKDGYTSDYITNAAGEILIDHIEDLAEIARMVLRVPREQFEYMDDQGLAEFFSQLLDNEPNIIKEAVVFLMLSSSQTNTEGGKTQTKSKPDTPQN